MSMAVITGASAGLGREFVKAVRDQHPEIDEYLLIARRRDRLEAVAADLTGVKTHLLALDLTDPAGFDEIARFLSERRPDIRLLVNNAGFGTLGELEKSSVSSQLNMTALNCGALTALCALAAPFMKRGAAIVNVSSIAAFVPTPRMATYAATKAYALSLSRALREELRPRGVNVLAVCPGPMDTEFLDVAGISGRSRLFERIPHIAPDRVAAGAVRQAFRGRAVYTPTLVYRLYRLIAKLLPRAWLIPGATC